MIDAYNIFNSDRLTCYERTKLNQRKYDESDEIKKSKRI